MQPLSSLRSGQHARVARILDDANSEMLRYLAELGLVPGIAFRVQSVAPFDGPFTLAIDGHDLVVGRNVADAILVEVVP